MPGVAAPESPVSQLGSLEAFSSARAPSGGPVENSPGAGRGRGGCRGKLSSGFWQERKQSGRVLVDRTATYLIRTTGLLLSVSR